MESKRDRILAKFQKVRPTRKSGEVHGDCLDWSQIQEVTWEAFFKNVEFTSECWVWHGGIRKGYGRFESKKKEWRAHRWSYCAFIGPIPAGHDIDHMCENTRCVNPWHLQPLTRSQHNILTKMRIKEKDEENE